MAGRLTAFDIAADGTLSNRRALRPRASDRTASAWTLTAPSGSTWASSATTCVGRVREGGEVLDRIQLDLACFATACSAARTATRCSCSAADWRMSEGFEDNIARLTQGPRTGQVLTAPAPAPGVGSAVVIGVEPFTIDVPEATLSDLRERIRDTRWPPAVAGAGLGAGDRARVPARAARLLGRRVRLARAGAAAERVRAVRRPTAIHFVHVKRGGIPLILTHGWPSTFVEHLQLVPHLDGFDLVIPSLPGYGFSERPARTTMRDTARRWHRADAGPRLRALRRPGRRLRRRRHRLHGARRSRAADRHPPAPDRHAAVRGRAGDRRRARVPRGGRGVGRRRARLQLDPVDQAADRRLRAQRLAGRARRVDRREVALVEPRPRSGSTATCCSPT